MDQFDLNNPELTPEQIENIKRKFGSEYVEKAQQIDQEMQQNGGQVPDFVMRELSPEQSEKLKNLLSDNDTINRLLSSEQAQQLLNKMFEE